MYKIEVKRSSIVINNYMPGDAVRLEHFFSIWDKTRFKYNPKAIKYDIKEKKLYIPRGYNISKVEEYIHDNAFINEESDEFDKDINIKLRYLPRDEVQKEAIEFILGNGKYHYTQDKSQLAINLNTGAGKTYVSIVSAAVMRVRTLMITSSIQWINQWKNKIIEYTDTKPKEVYLLIGIGSIAKLLNGMVKINSYKYILASHQTIKSYGDKYGWDKVGELFKLLRVGLKLYDEAHIDFDNICSIDFATNTNKTLYLTATPMQSDPSNNIIYQGSFEFVPSINLFNEDTDPRTHYLAMSYTSHPSPLDIDKCKNVYGFNRLAYCGYIIERPNFYKIIRILVEISLSKGKTLMYIGTNQAIKTIYNWMVYSFPELADQIGIYSMLIKDKVLKDQQLDKHIILTTTKSCGAAMDIPGLKLTVILAEPFRTNILARQTLGRTRDYDTDYIEIIDRGFYSIQNYYKSKLPLFEKYALSTDFERFSDDKLDSLYSQAIDLQMQRYNKYAGECKKLLTIVDEIPKEKE